MVVMAVMLGWVCAGLSVLVFMAYLGFLEKQT